ncbi:MAG TPA: hypothetical protein VK899_01295 [Gemmatimonadales bacterium]|nr:hypothetical protein [Gemmatimonadales bacterium]
MAQHVELTGPIADDDGILEQAMVIEAAGDRGLAGQPHRLGASDPECDQVIGPSGIPSFLGMGEVDPDVWHLKYRSTEAAM